MLLLRSKAPNSNATLLSCAKWFCWIAQGCPILATTILLTTVVQELTTAARVSAQPIAATRVVVNSNADGAIQADSGLTLREAIAFANGSLNLNQLSEAEKAQVHNITAAIGSKIEFDLPIEQTTILLQDELPALNTPGLSIDGTTQPGYGNTLTSEIAAPIVAIAPAPGTTILRGLTVTADSVTVRGLSLYGFTSIHRETASTPPADIFISHTPPPPDTSEPLSNNNFPFRDRDIPPQGVVIENNWLGVPPTSVTDPQLSTPNLTSAFGVSIFNATGTIIQNNYIANHDGSGIITSVRAENTLIRNNVIENNGFAGMPDAIRLEGLINNTQIESNQISGNAGSGVFLFKPDGSVIIRNNQITFNGRRLRRAAIYLLGSGHQVTDNLIQDQSDAGVAVGAFPRSDRNLIQHNRFARLGGLSIDLNTQLNVAPENFQRGDGPNPPRNSSNRRLETGNAAINAPQFLSRDFLLINGKVNIDGVADPGSQVELYRVEESDTLYGPLSEPIATTETDAEGRFSFTLDGLQPGDRISAIATDPRYGTSEPALNAVVYSNHTPSLENTQVNEEDMQSEASGEQR